MTIPMTGLFPATMPSVAPDSTDERFWHYCNATDLRFQACSACDTPRHPPTPVCPACLSMQQKWIPAPEEGSVFSFTVVHHASHEAVQSSLPYVVATIEFDGIPNVRLVSNVITDEVTQIAIGTRVRLIWQRDGQGQTLPRFVPITSQEGTV